MLARRSRGARAADDGALALLVAALWAVAPEGGAIGIGACAGAELAGRMQHALAAERDVLAARVGALEQEAASRAATAAAEAERATQLHAKLASERALRRAAESEATTSAAQHAADQQELARAHELLEQAHESLERGQRELDGLRTALAHEQQRARELERAIDEAGAAPRAAPPGTTPIPADELAELGDAAAELTRRLPRRGDPHCHRVAGPDCAHIARRVACAGSCRAGDAHETPPARRTPGRQRRRRTGDAVRRGATLVVDGYNVSNHAWPATMLSLQRDRLERGLQQVHQRFRCEVVCCYDGDDTVGVTPRRVPGVRVRFSARHEEADELVVETVRSLPKRVPVVVASSDAWVREHAEDLGAVAISAATAAALIAAAGRR